MRFSNVSGQDLDFDLDGRRMKVPVGSCCEIPDEIAYVVASRGLPLVPVADVEPTARPFDKGADMRRLAGVDEAAYQAAVIAEAPTEPAPEAAPVEPEAEPEPAPPPEGEPTEPAPEAAPVEPPAASGAREERRRGRR